MALSDVIAKLSVSLSLDTASYNKSAQQAVTTTDKMKAGITKAAGAIGAALGGMFALETVNQLRNMSKAALDVVGSLGEEAQQLGVTTDALQEFRFVASQTGIEQGEIDKALQRITRTLGDLANPTKVQTAALEKLGITAKELKGVDAAEFMGMLADGMNKLPDAASKSSVGFDLLGKSFQTLLPLLNEGSKGINQMIAEAQAAGIVLSEEQIKQADEYADRLTFLQLKTDAALNSLLAKNGEATVKMEEDWAKMKIALINLSIDIQKFADNFGRAMDMTTGYLHNKLIRPAIDGTVTIAKCFAQLAVTVPKYISDMVSGIYNQLVGRLNSIWSGVKAQVDAVKGWFYDLYDSVIGHSYIPDMVDGIAAEMGRLDKVMVAPVTAATTKAQEAFREMSGEILGILQRLYPEIEAQAQYAKDKASLGGIQDEDVRAGALIRLAGEHDAQTQSSRPTFDWMSEIEPMTQALDAGDRALDQFAKRAEDNTVRVAKSFKDMAEGTMSALGKLSSAIKGGGFLNILEAVIGFGIQLGSIGAFGKGVQNNLNKTPAYASGTNFHPGGLAMVGEKGPELVNMPRGSKVYPNGAMGGNVYHISGNLLTPEFWAQIQARDMAAANAGSVAGVARMNYRNSRRVG
jgi:hypothetical protein